MYLCSLREEGRQGAARLLRCAPALRVTPFLAAAVFHLWKQNKKSFASTIPKHNFPFTPRGDTTTLDETLCEAGEQVAEQIGREAESHPNQEPKVNLGGIEELVTDKGYHSGAVVKRVKSYEVRSYIPEKKQKGRRHWQGQRGEQQAVYENRRRVRGEYGKSLLRRRGELIERSFAHCYETGGMRRCYLRGRENILKRQLIHVGAFNLSLILRKLLGAGTPRELRNRAGRVFWRLLRLLMGLTTTVSPTGLLTPCIGARSATFSPCRRTRRRLRTFASSATGC